MKRQNYSLSDMKEKVTAQLEASASVKKNLMKNQADVICRMAETIIGAYRRGGKLLVCGNGGSAADAQHMAAELVGRFLKERKPLECVALTTNSSILTAIGNDYGYGAVFARQVNAHGREGDVLLAISTSGNSENVLKAIEAARRLKMKCLGLSGRDGGRLAAEADICLTVSSHVCPRIQEGHITVIHIMCDLIEQALFG